VGHVRLRSPVLEARLLAGMLGAKNVGLSKGCFVIPVTMIGAL
jgi:hypothetical protein